jgi:hypothetical protein
MTELHIPLSSGAHEEADAKLLPQGKLLRVMNARIRKDGRMGVRNGYVTQAAPHIVDTLGAAPIDGGALSLWSRVSRGVPTYDVRTATSTRNGLACPTLSELTAPTRLAVTRGNLQYGGVVGDTALVGTKIYVAVVDEDLRDYTKVGNIRIDELDLTGRHTGWSCTIGGADKTSAVKLCVLAGILYVFYANLTDSSVYVQSITPITHTIGTAYHVLTLTATTVTHFDARTLPGAGGTLHLYLAALVGLNINLYWVATGGSVTLLTSSPEIATVAYPTICYSSGYAEIVLVWYTGASWTLGNIYASSWRVADWSLQVNAETLNPSSAGGVPLVAEDWPVGRFVAAWGYGPATGPPIRAFGSGICAYGDSGVTVDAPGCIPVTRPFALPAGEMALWVTDRTSVRPSSGQGSYWLLEVAAGDVILRRVAMAAHLEAAPKSVDYYRTDARSTVTATSATQMAAYLPTYIGNERYGCDLFVLESGSKLWAKLNGQIFFSGAQLHVFDGDVLVADGLLDGPTIQSVANGSAGAIPAGDYQYIAIWEWTDAGGRKYRSPPSLPLTKTQASPWTAATVAVYPYDGVAATSGGWITSETGKRGVNVVVYRTVKDGSIFYRLPLLQTVSALGPNDPTISDVWTDANIIDQEVLYTQGERGGASGLLANDPPPPCRYIAAGNDRLMVGGLEQRDEVRFSKLIFPGEPVQWSDDLAFRARLPGMVTGVAFLDGAWYAWTSDAVYQIAGDGPDDTGAGYFSEARRVQSEVGCLDGRSVVSIGSGIMFQAKSDRIYRLPRGGCTPEWISQQMREELAAYPTITSAIVVPSQNAIVFGCYKDSTHGALIWYDVRTEEWYCDELGLGVLSVSLYGDALLVNGQIAETPSVWTDNWDVMGAAAITYEMVTGDIRPFGIIGQGRTRKVVILGEYRSGAVVALSVSYDSGQTWADSVGWTLAGFTLGDPIELEHRLKYVRGCSYRIKLSVICSVTQGGLLLSGLSFELFPSAGTKRLRAAMITG